MTTITFAFNMGLLINTGPHFKGNMLDLWKTRFNFFIKANEFKIWDILINGLFVRTFSFNYEIVNKPDFE